MPHVLVEYSANLKEHVEIGDLLRCIHDAAGSHATVPLAGLRTRALERNEYLIANGNNKNLFLAVVARLNGDRGADSLIEVRDLISDACRVFLSELLASHPLALSVEVHPLDSSMRINQNSIRDHYEEFE